ncbi:hypothetical protein [Celeribacter marinus]|uniref:hypothetical protein n=1 Tax=Celeribacter marinus TaxID=1397108 RepID=UPI003171FC6A
MTTHTIMMTLGTPDPDKPMPRYYSEWVRKCTVDGAPLGWRAPKNQLALNVYSFRGRSV